MILSLSVSTADDGLTTSTFTGSRVDRTDCSLKETSVSIKSNETLQRFYTCFHLNAQLDSALTPIHSKHGKKWNGLCKRENGGEYRKIKVKKLEKLQHTRQYFIKSIDFHDFAYIPASDLLPDFAGLLIGGEKLSQFTRAKAGMIRETIRKRFFWSSILRIQWIHFYFILRINVRLEIF